MCDKQQKKFQFDKTNFCNQKNLVYENDPLSTALGQRNYEHINAKT